MSDNHYPRRRDGFPVEQRILNKDHGGSGRGHTAMEALHSKKARLIGGIGEPEFSGPATTLSDHFGKTYRF